MSDLCDGFLHPRSLDGIKLFNRGDFFEAHEAFEDAWRTTDTSLRELYRGILQVAVVYLHITRGNYAGALKVYHRSQKWLANWPESCRGVNIGQLCRDLDTVIAMVCELGENGLEYFDHSLLKAIEYEAQTDKSPTAPTTDKRPARVKHSYKCDRCGFTMIERQCKITCPNCGNRFDCSDLNIYFD